MLRLELFEAYGRGLGVAKKGRGRTRRERAKFGVWNRDWYVELVVMGTSIV